MLIKQLFEKLDVANISQEVYRSSYNSVISILTRISNDNPDIITTNNYDSSVRYVQQYLESTLESILESYSLEGIQVLFASSNLKDDWEGQYRYDLKLIIILNKLVTTLARDCINCIYQFVSAAQEEEARVTKNDIESELSYRVGDDLSKIVEVFIHELSHASQFQKAKDSQNYRSYLEKSKELFWEKINNKNIPKHERDMLYYASPEEIGAYAQGFVSNYINTILRDQTPYDQILLIDEFLKYELSLGNLHKTTQYKEYYKNIHPKIFRRYLKKVYEGLASYKDILLKKLYAK